MMEVTMQKEKVGTVDAGYKNTGYKNKSDIRTSFGETDSFLYMCIEIFRL